MPSLPDEIVHRLKRVCTRAIFGVPGGGGNLDLIQAARRADLPFVLTATETGGAIAAMAQAEVTGHPGACLTTLGPGAASVANGVACAYLDRAPLLVFTDAYAATAGRAFEHQRFDHQALFRPITKWSGSLSPGEIDDTLERAFAEVVGLPPGPVHVDCPADDGTAASSSHVPVAPGEASAAGSSSGLAADPIFAELLSRARRPLIVAGLGARRGEDAAAVRRLLERRGLPAMVTYKAKGVVPDDHPNFAGVFTQAVIERPLIQVSDLIVGVGLDPVELLPRQWTYTTPIVSVCRWRVSDSHLPFAAQHVGDIPASIDAIDSRLPRGEWDLADVRRQVAAQRRAIDIAGTGLTAQRVVAVAAEQLARECRVAVDAGAHMFAATMLWPVSAPNQLLISNGLSTMGFALPAAIGAALIDRERPVVALTGDGGLLMCAAELLTAAREKLRVIVIVFADDALSLIEIKQQRKGYEPAGVALGTVHWPAVAAGFGVAPFVARNETELANAVEQARRVQGPALIEARIDRSNYAKTSEAIRG